MPTFYLSHLTISDKHLTIDGDELHHIVNVFRFKAGDSITLTNGKGLLAKAIIKEVTKKTLTVDLIEKNQSQRPTRKIACAFSLLKNKHDLLIVEKLTELGVVDLFPMQTVNSVRLSKVNTHEKFIKTAIAAIKQCENPWLPTIHKPQTLEATIKIIIEHGYTPIVASETKPEQTLHSMFCTLSHHTPHTTHHCIVIGPEGGFDQTEFELFEKLNIPLVSLSPYTLRAETAAIVGVSQASLLEKIT
jgi:16S rRNA (uracil1498-N3)-methyltransferase